jgi:RecA/RadA recombinase
MATRVKLKEAKPRTRVAQKEGAQAPSFRRKEDVIPSDYFALGNDEEFRFFSSGCPVMDAALGGGWAGNRCINIVGDSSAGKTLLAIEAAANFKLKWPDAHVRYAEAEAAASRKYAEMQGMPKDTEWNGDGNPIETVEDVYDDIKRVMKKQKGRPVLYILDSLDAISDDDEMEEADKVVVDKKTGEESSGFNKGSYGAKKPKQMSKLFRLLVDDMESHPLCFMVISQTRDKIGVTFGSTKTRSGGKALQFYCSQIPWLHTEEHQKRTIGGIDRDVGVQVTAKIQKNKCGLPFRIASYPIIFGYGIDDLTACTEWLLENKREGALDEVGLSKAGYKVRIRNLIDKGGEEAKELRTKLRDIVFREWAAIETSFLPKSRKYD